MWQKSGALCRRMLVVLTASILASWFAVAPRATPVEGGLGRGLHLLMIEAAGCFYCEKWQEDIGESYDKTREGKFAPLVRQHITDQRGDGIRPVVYTPTFVLVRDGSEVGRLTGYISEDFFWGLLTPMLEREGYGPPADGRKS